MREPRRIQALALFLFAVATLTLVVCRSEGAAAQPPDSQVIAPDNGKGPVVILLSGGSGPGRYVPFAKDIAKLGYTAVLVDGNQVLNGDSADTMRAVVGSALANPGTIGTKVVVIGFSLGGGEALVRAATLAESVAGVIAYYPTLTFIGNTRDTAVRITVPTLVLAGEQDMYRACCLVETARAFETAAREAHRPVILLTYAGAGHGFNLGPPTFEYDAAATAAAWEQTRAFLAKHLPLN